MKKRIGLLAVAALLVLAALAWRLPRETPPGVNPPAAPRPLPTLPAEGPAAAGPAPAAPRPQPEVPPTEEEDTLLVRDALTKAPIPGAHVFAHPGPGGGKFPGGTCWGELNPPPACLARGPFGTTGADGRFSCPGLGLAVVHVVAAGHRWGLPERNADGLVADLLPGSAVRLAIGRWGELEEPLLFAERGDVPEGIDPAAPAASVVVEGDEPDVVLDHSESHPVTGSERTVDEGIAAGTWTYFVRRGTRDGEIYARGIVTVAEGETADLRLDAVPVSAGPRFPVKVVAVIPKGWMSCIEDWDVEVASDSFIADPTPRFALKGLDPLNRHLEASGSSVRPDPDGIWRDTLKPDLPAGRYRVTVDPPGWVTEVEIAGPAPEVRLQLPEPGEVRVTLLDAATGKPIPNGWGRWAPAWKGLERGRWDAFDVKGSVPLYAPPGVCHVEFGADGYLDAERDLSFDAGAAAVVKVVLRPAAILVVHLRLDGKPFEGGGWVEATLDLDGDEVDRLSGESETGGVVTLQADGFTKGESRLAGLWGGPHKVTITHVPGFEPVPPKRVEVRFGTVTEIEFDLVRAK